jgi:uncharacterized protein (DUF2062 family)
MWHASRDAAQRWIQSLLHTHDSPERTAAAVGLGVAIGFSPFIGFHTVIGIVLAFCFNLNRVAVLGGLWVNLPWIMGAYYAAATAVGSWLLQTRVPPHLMTRLELVWSLPRWGARIDALGGLLEPLLWPFTLGSLLGSIIFGVLAYRLVLAILLARRHHLEAGKGQRGKGLGLGGKG